MPVASSTTLCERFRPVLATGSTRDPPGLPRDLLALHRDCKVRNNSLEVLALGRIKVGKCLDSSFLDGSIFPPSHLDSLWLRRVCYGLLLAAVHHDTTASPAGPPVASPNPRTLAIQPKWKGKSEGLHIVEFSFSRSDRIACEVPPLFIFALPAGSGPLEVLSAQSLLAAPTQTKMAAFLAATWGEGSATSNALDTLIAAAVRVVIATTTEPLSAGDVDAIL